MLPVATNCFTAGVIISTYVTNLDGRLQADALHRFFLSAEIFGWVLNQQADKLVRTLKRFEIS